MSRLSQLRKRIRSRFSKTYTSTSGKPTKRCGFVSAFGETAFIDMPLNDAGSVDNTLEEIGNMTIRCAWCGKPIFIGEPVTLLTPTAKDYTPPEYAVVFTTEPLRLVGCCGFRCSDGGMDICGQWVPGVNGKGLVQRRPSITDILIANPDAKGAIMNCNEDGIRVDVYK